VNRLSEHDDLLDDVMAESAPADFRDALLTDTLRHVRRRRWTRRVGRVALAAACAIGLLVWRNAPRSAATVSFAAGCAVVCTQPFPARAIVSTRSFDPGRVVATFASVGVVRTRLVAGSLRVINDDELLALAAPRLPALVRTGPHTQELIFLALTEPDARR